MLNPFFGTCWEISEARLHVSRHSVACLALPQADANDLLFSSVLTLVSELEAEEEGRVTLLAALVASDNAFLAA